MGRKAGELHARFGVKLRVHEKAFQAGTFAMGVYAYCQLQARAEERRNDGHFSVRVVVHGCWGGSPRKIREALDRLVAVGLLSAVDDETMCVVNYADWNETWSEIQERRSRDRNRKRASEVPSEVTQAAPPAAPSHSDTFPTQFRPESRRIPPGASDSGICTVSGSGSDPEEELEKPTNDVAPAERDGPTARRESREFEYRDAYARGMSAGLRVPWVFPDGVWAQGALNQAIQAHSGGRRGERLLRWVEAAADDFGAWLAHRPDRAQYYGHGSPKHFARWLTERAMEHDARDVG